METPLSLQLQQAWLQTQMRKQQHPSDLVSPSPDASFSSSFSSSQQYLSQDDDSLRDPVLQYINDMLMEEDMEDRLCMMQECMSYHATMKGFSEILGVSDDDLGVYPSLPQQQQPQQEDHGKQEQPQQSFDLNSEEYQWMNGLLNMEEAVAQLQELPSSISLGGSDFSPPLSSDSSGNLLLSPPQSCGQSSNNAAQDPFSGTHAASAVETPPSSVNSASAPLNFDSYEHRDNVIENGRFSHQLARGAMSENSELSTGSSTKSGRFKRAASQRDWIERPETYKQWQNRTQRAGFEQVPLDQNVVNKAQQIVRTSYHKDFGVEEDGRWMLLSWKGRILQGLSLWKPALMDAK